MLQSAAARSIAACRRERLPEGSEKEYQCTFLGHVLAARIGSEPLEAPKDQVTSQKDGRLKLLPNRVRYLALSMLASYAIRRSASDRMEYAWAISLNKASAAAFCAGRVALSGWYLRASCLHGTGVMCEVSLSYACTLAPEMQPGDRCQRWVWSAGRFVP